MTYFENKQLEAYNDMIHLLKYYDFYAMPRQYKNNALEVVNIEKLSRARVEFGRYKLTDDVTLLQPAKTLSETSEFLYGLLTFEFNTSEFKKEIIYVDNMLIYAKSKINKDDVFILTEKHFYSTFVRNEYLITESVKLNLHPYKERYE